MLSNHPPPRRYAFIFSATLFVTTVGVACALEPRPRPTQLDPANPAASESPPIILSALSPHPGKPLPPAAATSSEKSGKDDGKSESKPGGEPQGQPAGPAAAVYTCPMHPEVTSDKPGRCPKCGMKLVPKKPIQGKQ